MKKYYYFFISFFILNNITYAQTYSVNPNGLITDNATTNFTMSVSGLPNKMDLGNIGLESVRFNVIHPKDNDLVITLISPAGKQVIMAKNNGGAAANYSNTTLYDTIPTNVNAGTAPFAGSYAPYEALSNHNNNANPNGIWTLRIQDQVATNTGTLQSWSLKFGNKPAGKVSFFSSNLPIVVINTGTQTIPSGTKITATMSVIEYSMGANTITQTPNNYNGFIGIEIRGQTSAAFPQKQYGIETRDAQGNNLNTSVLGMPTENDWILYAPYNDKSLMRNAITYKLSRDMGRWASRGKFCEVVINNIYQGVYVFQEKIKRDSNRVNVAKLTIADTVGNNLTGGYIVNIDKDPVSWYSAIPPNNSNNNQKIRFTHYYPDTIAIHIKQKKYIKQYIDSFETALNGLNYMDPVIGYRKYASVKSFVDYFIINEVSKNVDGYRLSTFLHKEKITSGGQLKIGPVWDYNLAFNNANYCSASTATTYAYKFNTVCGNDSWQVPFWWDKLMTDTCFKNRLYCRYSNLRTNLLDTVNFFQVIDSMASLVNVAQIRHFKRYSILGTYVWPNPTPYATTYAKEIRNMKNWIKLRLAWLDSQILPFGTCPSPIVTVVKNKNESLISAQVFPNPFQTGFVVNLNVNKPSSYQIDIFNLNAEKIKTLVTDNLQADDYFFHIDELSYLRPGMYLVKIKSDTGEIKTLKLLKN